MYVALFGRYNEDPAQSSRCKGPFCVMVKSLLKFALYFGLIRSSFNVRQNTAIPAINQGVLAQGILECYCTCAYFHYGSCLALHCKLSKML